MSASSAKICILPPNLGLGGPASFQAGLIQIFKASGVSVTHDLHEPGLSAILIFGAGADLPELKKAQSAGLRVVQRLNGMNWVHRRKFTGVKHFIKAEYGNFKLRSVRNLADGVIYQSQFARGWWEREYGVLDKPSLVIHNGVDLDLFSAEPDARPADRYRLLMVEARHGGGYDQGLRTGIELAKWLNGTIDKPVELTVVGEVPAVLRREYDDPWINWLGVLEHTRIPQVDRSAHLFFSADVNAACPNAVLEALACGLPVVAFDTGSMAELIPISVGRLAPYGGDVWRLELPDTQALVNASTEILNGIDNYRMAARQHAADHFNIRDVAGQYLEFLLEG